MKKLVHIVIKFCISLILIGSVVAGYLPEPGLVIELTCMSNFLIGVLFLVSAIRMLTGKKDFNNTFYSTALVTIMLVFLVCAGSLSGMYHMNFSGAFMFLHVINPILIFIYYMIFINEKKYGKIKNIFVTPCFALTYLLCDYIIGTVVKKFVYGFFEPGKLNILMALLVGLTVYVFMIIIGFAIYGINHLLPKAEVIS